MKKLRNAAFLLLMVVILVFGAPSRAMVAQQCWGGCDCDWSWYILNGQYHLVWLMNCLEACELITDPECEADLGLFCWENFETTWGGCYPATCIALCDLGIIE